MRNKYNNTTLAVKEPNIIPIEVLRFPKPEPKPKSNKAREYNGGGHPAGQSSEVYAFRTEDEIKAMITVFDKHIENARDKHVRQIAERNKLLFVVGINCSLRASDLRNAKYSDFYEIDKDGNLVFKKFYVVMPKKQRKQRKFVKLFFNETLKKAIENYIKKYPFENLNDYLFASREGSEPITEKTMWRIIKDTAKEAGLPLRYGSHSLRKSWAYHVWHNAEDKEKALVMLMRCFNHSSIATTMRYIGIMDDEIKDVYESVELGFDMI